MVLALVWLCFVIIGLSLLMMIGFGLRNAGTTLAGSKLGLAAFALPAILFVVLYAVNSGNPEGGWQTAAVLTAIIMAALGLLSLVIFGAKSLFS